ncbi:DUF11 domain-containing protein [Emticicia soli]|uniref:DUF11 domain-containing protein n=1 Tax=Emticicia soli TaxID=2027878 RepID=A0ABW5J9U5_9BACT
MVTLKNLLLVILTLCTSFAFSQQTIENNRICNDPIVGRGVYALPSLSGGGICLLCNTSDAANVTDGNLDNYGVAAIPAGAISTTVLIAIKDSLQYYPGGNTVGFVIGGHNGGLLNGGLLSASILSNLSIQTLRNGTVVQTVNYTTGSSGLLLGVLQATSTGKQVLSFATGAGQDFDEVRLIASGTVAALTSVRIYEAFESPAGCATDCVNALVGTDASGAPATGSSGVCLGGSVANAGNTTDSDSTNNFATITLPTLGLGCDRYIQVNASTIYDEGTFAGFVISETSGLLGLDLLGGITIETFNGGISQESSVGSALLTANVLNGSTNSYQVGFRTTKKFNAIRITIRSLGVNLGGTYRIYYAYVKADSDNDGIPNCLDKCSGSDAVDTDGDGVPDACDNNIIDLSLTKGVDNSRPAQGGAVAFTVTITRDNTTQNATGVKVTDLLPAGLTYTGHTAPTGTQYSQTTGIWNVGSALGGTTNSLSLVINATADSTGVIINQASITASNETDTDNSSLQDHIASACVTVPIQICQGSSIILVAPSAPSYVWYRDGVPIPGGTNDSLVVTLSGDYTVNFTSSSGCASGNCCPIVVNVNALPSISAGADVAVCSGVSTTLTATGTGTFQWNTGETTASISVSPTLTTNYIVRLTNALGCTNADTVIVTANPSPLSANAIAICNNAGTTDNSLDDTFTITLNPSGGSGIGASYSVALNGSAVTGVSFTYGTQSSPISAGLISGGSKTLLITDNNGCTLNTTVNPPASCSSCPTKVCVPITIVKSE